MYCYGDSGSRAQWDSHNTGWPSGWRPADTDEKIAGIVAREEETRAPMEIDASGKYVVTGLIDPHAHVRVPGYEYKEDITTASSAAAVGGYTSFVDMPNVEPPTDTVELYEKVRRIAEDTCIIDWGHMVFGCKWKGLGVDRTAGG